MQRIINVNIIQIENTILLTYENLISISAVFYPVSIAHVYLRINHELFSIVFNNFKVLVAE